MKTFGVNALMQKIVLLSGHQDPQSVSVLRQFLSHTLTSLQTSDLATFSLLSSVLCSLLDHRSSSVCSLSLSLSLSPPPSIPFTFSYPTVVLALDRVDKKAWYVLCLEAPPTHRYLVDVGKLQITLTHNYFYLCLFTL